MVLLEIPDPKYQFLLKTLDSSRAFIAQLGINPLLKQSMAKDIQIIKSIILSNRKAKSNGQESK